MLANVHRTIQMLQGFNWVINLKTSVLQPCLYLEYLGLILDTSKAKMFPS